MPYRTLKIRLQSYKISLIFANKLERICVFFYFSPIITHFDEKCTLRQIAISENMYVCRRETEDRMEILHHAAKLTVDEV